MFEKRPKFSFFILGMLFGALCGGILVYYNSVITNENKISVNLIPQIVKQVIGVINTKSDSQKDTTTLSLIQNNSDELNSNNNAVNEINESNLNNNEVNQSSDSLMSDTSGFNSEEEQITVKTEELLVAKEITVQNPEINTPSKSSKNDSLLAVVSGTKEENKKGSYQKIMVELWKSPINYRGYQASRNKIICFGLTNIDEVKLFNIKNNLYLKYSETVYFIELNSDFNTYEKTTDAFVLNLINKLNP